MSANVCLVCFIGLPASGKTYLCSLLKLFLEANYNVFTLHFDDEFNSIVSDVWKNKRINIWNKVNTIIESNLSNAKTVILLDDNMYYRSMRYEYVKLAKRYKTGYCQVYLETDLALCIERNLKRNTSVPEKIIKQMHARLEKPDKGKFPWEMHSLTLRQGYNESDALKKIDGLIESAVSDPLCYIEKVLNKADLDDTQVAHLVDLALRSCVNARMSLFLETNPSKKEIANIGIDSSKLKKELMQQIKTGTLTLPKIEDKRRDEILDLLHSYFLPMLP